ncbi:hypothetical protein Dsin_010488 [Dipteronia sinensis]|uniref:Uncharacterized protein n=1 Tax=Dipteronia sinensis TaxID=43782 RepID=A0AAE0ECM2_9ROSI|nr:hypothetical protein Dsin_010488 [Dipteronia sinensis]
MGWCFFSTFITILVFFSVNSSPVSVFGSKAGDQECKFPAIFNFGDSNSDTGGLYAFWGEMPAQDGMSFFGGPVGRYSDGRLVIDFIAESLGLPYLSSYLDSLGSDFSHGANFAFGGSSVRFPNTIGSIPLTLDVQWIQFLKFYNTALVLRKRGGIYKKLMPKPEYFTRALYTIDIGQNDLTAGYFTNKTTDEVKVYVPDVINRLQNVVRNIYNFGGRYFWIHNTGPVGCLPYVFVRKPVPASLIDEAGCATPYNEVSQFFNSKLKEAVVQLRKDLPSAAITYVDIYSIKYSLFREGRNHGFKELIRVCCGHGGQYNFNVSLGCGVSIMVDGKPVLMGKPCEDPSTYVVWDGVHFTQAANKFVFDKIGGGTFSDPSFPLKMACHKKNLQAH